MQLTTYYRWCLALPVVVPLAALAIPDDARGWIGDARFLLWASLIVGGPHYLCLAGASLWRLRKQSARSHARLLLIAPVVFASWLFVFSVAWEFSLERGSSSGWVLRSGAVLAGCGLALGYAYTALAHLLRIALQWAHLVARGTR